MASFPTTTQEIKAWITNTFEPSERKSTDSIIAFLDQHEVDGKMLVLFYKYPHELLNLLPNLRARLLFMNALDVLIKAVGKDIPSALISAELPQRSLISRLTFSSDTTFGQSLGGNAPQASSAEDKRPDEHVDNLSDMGSPLSEQIPQVHDDFGVGGGDDDNSGDIPVPVPLPIFDSYLQQAIASGRLRERVIRSRLANTCARFYVNLKMYPTQLDYHRICERLVEKYPDLRDMETRPGMHPWRYLKKLLSMAFCNVRRIMKAKDLMNARHIINNIQRRYRGFSRESRRLLIPPRMRCRSFSTTSTSSSEGGSSESTGSRKRVLPVPPPVPMFEPEIQRAITIGKLKERPWCTQFYRCCAKFYTKLKPYPSRRDYKNISAHLSKVFPDLGQPNQVKHMLSQYIRSHRQSKKLLKLDRQQKARMLTYELSGHKGFSGGMSGHGASHASSQNGPMAGSEYHFQGYDYNSSGNAVNRDGSSSTLNSNFFGGFAAAAGTTAAGGTPSSRPSTSSQQQQSSTVDIKPNILGGINQGSPLQYPVPLPPMDEAMWKGIREGQLQEKNLRGKFVRLCANFYVSLKSYPTKEDYNVICRTVITEFPDLRDPSPLPGCPPFMLFKKALTACIRNKRRDLLSPIPGNSSSDWSHSGGSAQRSSPHKEDRQKASSYFQHPHMPDFRDPSQAPTCFSTLTDVPTSSGSTFIPAIELLGRSRSHGEGGGGPYPTLCAPENFDGTPGSNHGHIPYPVPIPVFPSDLMMLLDTGQPILNDARTMFLQTCTEFYLRMKPYPNRADFGAICAQLVQTFPQLADPGSVPGRMGFTNLKKELSLHFCNYQQRVKSLSIGSAKDLPKISTAPTIIGGLNSLCIPTPLANSNSCPSGQMHSYPAQPPPLLHPPPAHASDSRRDTEQSTEKPIPYPAPLPRFPRIIQQTILQGCRLEGQARSRLLQVCAKFYTGIKYHPSRADYHSVCSTLLDRMPALHSPSLDKTQNLRRLKKELSLHIRSLRRRSKSGHAPPAMPPADGKLAAVPVFAAAPMQWFCAGNGAFPSVSAFSEYFNKPPTHEEVEKNITHLKELINELA